MKKQEKSDSLEKWKEVQKKVLNEEPFSYKLPKRKVKLQLLKFFSSKFYKRMTLFIIIFNFALLSIKYDNASYDLLSVIQIGSILLTFIYGIEMISKIYCYGFSSIYILNNKFRLEIAVFIIYFLDFWLFLTLYDSKLSSNKIWRIINSLKFLSILRVLNIIKSLKYLFRTFLFSLPSLLNLLLLMLLSFFTYANVGVYFFCGVRNGKILNNDLNFGNIFNGLLVLFKCLTCDNWSDIMFDIMDALNTKDNNSSFCKHLFIIF